MVQKPKVIIETIQYKDWNCKRIKNGPLELILLPQIGGRIIGINWKSHDLFFTQPDMEGKTKKNSEYIFHHQSKNRGTGSPLWGGDRTWLSLQTGWPKGNTFNDLDSGPYEFWVEEGGPETAKVGMRSPVCGETGIQITRLVETASGVQEWGVTHGIKNCSLKDIHFGIWAGTMVLRPGKVYFPRWKKSPFPLGIKTFDEIKGSIEVRNRVVNAMGKLGIIDCGDPDAFKFGADGQEGWMLGILEIPNLGLVGFRKQFPVFSDWGYGHDCITEVFNSDQYPYFEMTIHGPLISLKPGERFELQERQALFDVLQWPRREVDVREMVARSFSGKIGRDLVPLKKSV